MLSSAQHQMLKMTKLSKTIAPGRNLWKRGSLFRRLSCWLCHEPAHQDQHHWSPQESGLIFGGVKAYFGKKGLCGQAVVLHSMGPWLHWRGLWPQYQSGSVRLFSSQPASFRGPPDHYLTCAFHCHHFCAVNININSFVQTSQKYWKLLGRQSAHPP